MLVGQGVMRLVEIGRQIEGSFRPSRERGRGAAADDRAVRRAGQEGVSSNKM